MVQTATLPISISQFASDQKLLNTALWLKQAEILETFWQGNYSLAVWALGRRSGQSLMSAITVTYAATMIADALRKISAVSSHPRSGFWDTSLWNPEAQGWGDITKGFRYHLAYRIDYSISLSE